MLTMRMLCFLRRCFVSRRNRLLTSLSGMLLCSGTPRLQTHIKLQVQSMIQTSGHQSMARRSNGNGKFALSEYPVMPETSEINARLHHLSDLNQANW